VWCPGRACCSSAARLRARAFSDGIPVLSRVESLFWAGFRHVMHIGVYKTIALAECFFAAVAMPLGWGGQPPHTWHDDLCGFLKLCFNNAAWTG